MEGKIFENEGKIGRENARITLKSGRLSEKKFVLICLNFRTGEEDTEEGWKEGRIFSIIDDVCFCFYSCLFFRSLAHSFSLPPSYQSARLPISIDYVFVRKEREKRRQKPKASMIERFKNPQKKCKCGLACKTATKLRRGKEVEAN